MHLSLSLSVQCNHFRSSIFLTALIHTVLACNTATGTNNTTGQETCRTEHSSCVFTSAPQLYRLPGWLIVSITVTNMLSALISKDEQQCVGAAWGLFVGEKKKPVCGKLPTRSSEEWKCSTFPTQVSVRCTVWKTRKGYSAHLNRAKDFLMNNFSSGPRPMAKFHLHSPHLTVTLMSHKLRSQVSLTSCLIFSFNHNVKHSHSDLRAAGQKSTTCCSNLHFSSSTPWKLHAIKKGLKLRHCFTPNYQQHNKAGANNFTLKY